MEAKIGENRFWASGDARTMSVHERIVRHHENMSAVRTVAGYTASVGSAAIAAGLIMYAPAAREVAANIVAGALLLQSAGVAGFTTLRARAPGIQLEAGGGMPSDDFNGSGSDRPSKKAA